MQGLWCRVQGLGCRVEGVGLRVCLRHHLVRRHHEIPHVVARRRWGDHLRFRVRDSDFIGTFIDRAFLRSERATPRDSQGTPTLDRREETEANAVADASTDSAERHR